MGQNINCGRFFNAISFIKAYSYPCSLSKAISSHLLFDLPIILYFPFLLLIRAAIDVVSVTLHIIHGVFGLYACSLVLIYSDTLRIDCFIFCCFWLAGWSHGLFWRIVDFEPLLVLNSFVDVSCAGADNDNFYKMTNKLHQLERLCHRAMDVALDIQILPSMMRAVRSELITHYLSLSQSMQGVQCKQLQLVPLIVSCRGCGLDRHNCTNDWECLFRPARSRPRELQMR